MVLPHFADDKIEAQRGFFAGDQPAHQWQSQDLRLQPPSLSPPSPDALG